MSNYVHALPDDTQLGHYLLLEPLNNGGFGQTYMAWDFKLERNVVIKECFPTGLCVREQATGGIVPAHPNLAADYELALEAIKKEAKLLASQNHEHIVRVYDVFESHGTVCYVMPWLPGGSLLAKMAAAQTRQQALDPEWVQSCFYQILSALDYIHSRKLYHRDIKPSNILFDEKEQAILIDFGAALNIPELTHSMTQGVFSVAYAAPEQITGKGELGPWTDFYALAATWYRLISGKTVERSDARLVHDDTAALSSFEQAAAYPTGFIKAIEQNLSLRGADRFKDVNDWLLAIEGKERPEKKKHKKQQRQYLSYAIIAFIFLCFAGLSYVKQQEKQERRIPSQATTKTNKKPDSSQVSIPIEPIQEPATQPTEPEPEISITSEVAPEVATNETELNEPAPNKVKPINTSQLDQYIAGMGAPIEKEQEEASLVDTSVLDEYIAGMEELIELQKAEEKIYVKKMDSLVERYLTRIKEEIKKENPTLNLQFLLLEKERTNFENTIGPLAAQAGGYRNAWKDEVARLEQQGEQLSGEEQRAYYNELIERNGRWGMRYGNTLDFNKGNPLTYDYYKDCRERLYDYIDTNRRDRDANGKIKQRQPNANITLTDDYFNIEYLK